MENVTIKIGNHLTNQVDIITDNTCRTNEQVEAFKKWLIGNEEVLFFNINPFKIDRPNEKYNCTFTIMYTDKKGMFRTFEITPKGTIKNHWIGDTPIYDESEIQAIISFNKGIVTNF